VKSLEKSAEGIVFREVGNGPEPGVVCQVAVQRVLSRSLTRNPEFEITNGNRKVRLVTYRAAGTET
jgi:hypothetical protein